MCPIGSFKEDTYQLLLSVCFFPFVQGDWEGHNKHKTFYTIYEQFV